MHSEQAIHKLHYYHLIFKLWSKEFRSTIFIRGSLVLSITRDHVSIVVSEDVMVKEIRISIMTLSILTAFITTTVTLINICI